MSIKKCFTHILAITRTALSAVRARPAKSKFLLKRIELSPHFLPVNSQHLLQMNTHTTQVLNRASLLLALSATSLSASANLLVDPGFEANPLQYYLPVLHDFDGNQGSWGAEAATISGAFGGVTPVDGTKMMAMVNDGLTVTQAYQAVDVSSYASLIDSGQALINLSASINVGVSLSPPARAFVNVLYYGAPSLDSFIGESLQGVISVDSAPGTWQLSSSSGVVPVNTRWLLAQVGFNSSSLGDNTGYADGFALNIASIPEPSTVALLGLGLAGMWFARRRR